VRPARFEVFALEQLATHPAVARAAALRDIGDTAHPYGVGVQLAGGGEFRWQITAQSAPGESYARPEAPVEGDPAPVVAAPKPAGGWAPADGEALLAHVVTAAGCREVAEVVRWSLRDGAGAGTFGVTVRCYNGAVLYARPVRAPR
jgi:hypothetical protein